MKLQRRCEKTGHLHKKRYKQMQFNILSRMLTYVGLQILPGLIGEKNSDDFNMVLLGCHVERCETVLETAHNVRPR